MSTIREQNGAVGPYVSNGNATLETKVRKTQGTKGLGMKKSASMLALVPTKTKEEVPLLFREPHVETGFRALHQPWYYYLLSIFQLHNESMNVWTHLLALVLMTNKLVQFSKEVDFIHDPYSWPFLAGFVCGILLYSCSSGAHCMQSKSELVHYTSFMVDYAGIGLYGLGSVILHLQYCSEDDFYYAVNSFLVPLGGILAFLICFCCTVAKVIYKRPYPFRRKIWQITPVLGIYVVLMSPIVHKLFMCYTFGSLCEESSATHIRQSLWFIAGGIFFASDIPQKYRPGSCDVFGHSHQCFHICIMLCTLCQMDGVLMDFNNRRDIIRSRPQPTLASAFGPVIMVILAEAVCILTFRQRIKKKLLKEQE